MEVFKQRPPSLFSKAVFLASVICAFVTAGVIAFTQYLSYQDSWNDAKLFGENVLQASSREIHQNLKLYDEAVARAVHIVENNALGSSPADIRRLALFDSALSVNGFLSLSIVDRNGKLLETSSDRLAAGVDFSDCPNFLVHATEPNQGAHLSDFCPGQSQTNGPSIALTRRISLRDGSFAGVAIGEISLVYIGNSFQKLDLGKNGSIFLATRNGSILMRFPSSDGKGDIGYDFSEGPVFQNMRDKNQGSFTETARIDSVRRFYTFSAVGEWPLLIAVAVSIETVLNNWVSRTIAIGGMTFLLCIGIMGAGLVIRREIIKREHVEADLEMLSRSDGLTGLFNRRYFDEVMEREFRQAQRARTSLALLMVDADHFKILNDSFGHLRGDGILIDIAEAIRSSIRSPEDFAARYGGDEFAVILPGRSSEQAVKIGKRIQQRLSELQADTSLLDPKSPAPSISIGVASIVPSSTTTVKDLIAMTDKALYLVKGKGRNRVEFLEA